MIRKLLLAVLALAVPVVGQAGSKKFIPWSNVSAPWSPGNVTGLIADHDPDLLSGTDGDLITTLTASVGSNLTSSSTFRPALYNNVVNGRKVLRFVSASSNYMQGAVSVTGTTLTAITVVRFQSLAVNRRILSMGASGTADFNSASYTAAITESSSGGGAPLYATRASTNLSATAGLSTATTYIIVSRFDGTNHTMYVNSTTGSSPVASTGTFNISAMRLGGVLNGGNYMDADFCRLLVYNTAVSPTDLAYLIAGLKTLYGVP